jgi:hypothetical protein
MLNIDNKETTKFDFSVIPMDNYLDYTRNRKVPLNVELRNSRGWLDWGTQNLYPQYLLQLYEVKSSKHKTIIDRKKDMIGGGGFEKNENLNLFFENNWGNEPLNKVLRKISKDLMLFGAFSLKIIWNKTMTKINGIEYIPVSDIRAGWDYSADSFNGYFYYSPDWYYYTQSPNHPKPFPAFSLIDKAPVQIYYYSTNQYNKFYSSPDYSASINWLESDYEISNFHINSIKNGFAGGFHIHSSSGIPTVEEQDEIYRKMNQKMTGTNRANMIVMTYSNGEGDEVKMTPLFANDNDKKYLDLQQIIRDEIFYAHNVTSPKLFGVLVPGKLGGDDDMVESLEIYQAIYVDYVQKDIEECFQYLAKYADYTDYDKIKINKFKI